MTAQAYIFDVFGTVVDWRNSVARVVEREFSREGLTVDGIAFAEYWRSRYQPAMERIRSGNRGYVALDDLHFENLSETLEHFGLSNKFDEQNRWELNRAWEQLDPWPDVLTGLNDLKKRAIIAPCSNGSIALMARLGQYAELPWHCILGADIAQNYKPQPAVYHACCKALRLDPSDVMMVAAHNGDLAAAQTCGLKTAFIARPTEYGPDQKNDLEATGNWDLVIESFKEL